MVVARKKKIAAKKKATVAVKEKTSRITTAETDDWRSDMLAEIRSIIKEVVPDAIEEMKWRGVLVWSHGGMICTGESYKAYVKMTFAKGAALPDPHQLFNASLEGNTRRAIDIYEGGKINKAALKALIRAAVTLNLSKKR